MIQIWVVLPVSPLSLPPGGWPQLNTWGREKQGSWCEATEIGWGQIQEFASVL